MYVAGYGIGRAWIEGLRTDQLVIPGIGVPVSQVLSIVAAAAAIIIIVYKRIQTKKKSMQTEFSVKSEATEDDNRSEVEVSSTENEEN